MNQNERRYWRTRVEEEIGDASFLSFASRAEEIQYSAVQSIAALMTQLVDVKERAISDQDEDAANEILSWEAFLQGEKSGLLMWIALKRGNPNSAWEQSVDAEMGYRIAGRVHEWGAEFGSADRISRVIALQSFLFPAPVFISVGTLISESRCSICESIYGECDHIAGTAYMGKLATRQVVDAKLLEISVVEQPALKTARITEVPTQEGYRDFMSWRLVEAPKASSESEPD